MKTMRAKLKRVMDLISSLTEEKIVEAIRKRIRRKI